MSVVPKALLDMSRNVMRATFSSVMHKRVYTLHVDRGTDVEKKMVMKLKNAAKSGGVVVATPATVKSVMVKFLELLSKVGDETQKLETEMWVEMRQLSQMLDIFKTGVLMMDEVRLPYLYAGLYTNLYTYLIHLSTHMSYTQRERPSLCCKLRQQSEL